MPNIDIESAGEFIPEVWATLVQHPLRKNTVALGLTDRRWEMFLDSSGDRAHVPGYSEITANSEARSTNAGFDSRGAADGEWSEVGASITFTDLTASSTTIEVDTRTYSAIMIDDPVKIQQNVNTLQIMTAEMSRAIGEQIDTDIWTTMGTTANNKGALSQAITEETVMECIELLNTNKAKDEERYLVVSPEGYTDLLNIDRYTNALYQASMKTLSADKPRGYKGSLMDFEVYTSTNIPTSGNGHNNYFFQREAEAFVMQGGGVRVTRREPHDQFASAVRAVTYYGRSLMRGAAAIELRGR